MSIARMDRSREPRGRWRRAPALPGDVSRALDSAHPARVEALESALDGALAAFGLALEVRGLAPLGHGGRVASWAERLGREVGLDRAALRGLRWGAMLHDVGLLAIVSSARTPGASASAREHPLYGLELLRPVPGLPAETLEAVRSHHERWDGAGFPEGLSGEEIPLAARIVAVAEALARHEAESGEGSARARGRAEAEIRDGIGRRFDPHVGAFALHLLDAFAGPG